MLQGTQICELMELYLAKRSDEFNFHDERDVFEATSIEDVASPQVDWCNWGVTQSKDECFFTSTIPYFEDLNINRQNLDAQTINEPSNYEGNRSSCASICGQTSLMGCSVRNSKDFDGHPDSELENNMEETDDTFFNSFVEDDEIIPDSVYLSLPFEDLLSNMDSDSQSWLDSAGRGNFAYISSSSSLLFMDHELEDCENANDNLSRRLMPAESKRTEGSTADVLSATKYNTVSDADEQPQGFEATVLLELEDVMIQLSSKTRICLRDSLYRLANSSKQQHITHQKESVSCSDKLPTAQNTGESYSDMPSGDSGMAVRAECVESNANAIDWTVANLMYNTAMCDPQLLSP